MSRPKKCRFVENFPDVTIFKPKGNFPIESESVIIGYEELEALRLADLEAKKQEDAAKTMNVSRATFGRIVNKARFLVADALLNGKTIIIKGGELCCHSIPNLKTDVQIDQILRKTKQNCANCPKNERQCKDLSI